MSAKYLGKFSLDKDAATGHWNITGAAGGVIVVKTEAEGKLIHAALAKKLEEEDSSIGGWDDMEVAVENGTVCFKIKGGASDAQGYLGESDWYSVDVPYQPV